MSTRNCTKPPGVYCREHNAEGRGAPATRLDNIPDASLAEQLKEAPLEWVFEMGLSRHELHQALAGRTDEVDRYFNGALYGLSNDHRLEEEVHYNLFDAIPEGEAKFTVAFHTDKFPPSIEVALTPTLNKGTVWEMAGDPNELGVRDALDSIRDEGQHLSYDEAVRIAGRLNDEADSNGWQGRYEINEIEEDIRELLRLTPSTDDDDPADYYGLPDNKAAQFQIYIETSYDTFDLITPEDVEVYWERFYSYGDDDE